MRSERYMGINAMKTAVKCKMTAYRWTDHINYLGTALSVHLKNVYVHHESTYLSLMDIGLCR